MCSKKEILWVESHDLSQTDNSYNSVFFSKVEWWVVELLFVSLNNWGLNFLQNEFSQSSQIYLSQEKLRKMFTFSILKWLFAELSKMTTIFTQNSPWMSFEWKVVSFCEFAQFSKQSFARLKSKHFSQFFWWEVNLRGLRDSFCRKFRPQLLKDRKKSSATHHSTLEKKILL